MPSKKERKHQQMSYPIKNSAENLSQGQEILKATAESDNSLDVQVNFLNSSSSLEKPFETCLHREDCSDRKDNDQSNNTKSYGRSVNNESRTANDDDESVASGVVDCDDNRGEGSRNARELLMYQIKSLIRDPDIEVFCKSQSLKDDFEFKRAVEGVESNNLEMEDAKSGPLDDACIAYDKISHNEAFDNMLSSDNSNNAVAADGKFEHDKTETEVKCELSSDSVNSLSEHCISKGNFFGDENELEIVLQLLLSLKDVCFENEAQYENHNVEHFKALEEEHLRIEEPGITEDTCSASPILPTSDEPDERSERDKEYIRCLKKIDDFLERKRFSSALELEQFLGKVEKMKNVMNNEQFRQLQNLKQNFEAVPLNIKLEDAKSLNESLSILSSKIYGNTNHLSEKLIKWQEFNETRAELKYELAQERCELESIEARISHNSPEKANLEAEHDLKLVEEMEEMYYDKLTKLQKLNHDLKECFEENSYVNHRSQLETFANELQHVKMLCVKLRKKLGLPNFLSETVDEHFKKEEKISYSVHSQTDDIDGSNKVTPSISLLKLLLLLLIVLFLFIFIFFLEPGFFRPVNRFRLPVPLHLRHVGTYPPI